MARSVIDRDLGMKRIAKSLRDLSKKEIATGLHAGEKTSDGKKDLAFVGAILEFGAVVNAPEWWYHRNKITIPSRPFLRTPFDEQNKKWTALANSEVRQIIDNNKNIDSALASIGNVIKEDIQKRIVSGPWVPNHPWTIKHKGHDKPLIETGHMLRSVKYKIRKRRSRSIQK